MEKGGTKKKKTELTNRRRGREFWKGVLLGGTWGEGGGRGVLVQTQTT